VLNQWSNIVVRQGLEKAVELALRKLGQATTKQLLEKVVGTYPRATNHRVRKILRESDFAERGVGQITVTAETGPYEKQGQVWVYKSASKSDETAQEASEEPEEPQILLNQHSLLSPSVLIHRFDFEIRAGKTAIDALEVQVGHGYGFPGEWVNLDLREYDFNEVEKGKSGDPIKRIALLSHDIQKCTFVTFYVITPTEIRFTMRTSDSTKQPKYTKLIWVTPLFEVYARFVGLAKAIEKRYIVVYNKPPSRAVSGTEVPRNEPVELVDASSERGQQLLEYRQNIISQLARKGPHEPDAHEDSCTCNSKD
jgi:hypothetical protein